MKKEKPTEVGEQTQSYKDHTLWKQAVELQEKSNSELIGYADRISFQQENQELANVVLAYFSGRQICEMKDFGNTLVKLAEDYGGQHSYKYPYNANVCNSNIIREQSKQAVEQLWASFHDSNSNPDGCCCKKKPLNIFQRFLNSCILFLKFK